MVAPLLSGGVTGLGVGVGVGVTGVGVGVGVGVGEHKVFRESDDALP